MKFYHAIFAALVTFSIFASPFCQSGTIANQARESRITRITKSQLSSAMNAENIPTTASALQFVRQTNPKLNQAQWGEILGEVNDAMSTGMSQPGNPVFEANKKLFSSFSEVELAKLENLLDDPVYRKYSTAIASPAVQEALVQGMIENSPWMLEAMNLVLRNHGLKDVH